MEVVIRWPHLIYKFFKSFKRIEGFLKTLFLHQRICNRLIKEFDCNFSLELNSLSGWVPTYKFFCRLDSYLREGGSCCLAQL